MALLVQPPDGPGLSTKCGWQGIDLSADGDLPMRMQTKRAESCGTIESD